MTTAVTNLLNPGTTTGGVNCTASPYDKLYILLQHIKVVNKTTGANTVSLYVGGTGSSTAGTETAFSCSSVSANSNLEAWFGKGLRLDTVDFLTGNASGNAGLTIEGEGEIGVW